MITLALSPCPNDTFIFEAIIHKRIDLEGLNFSISLHDVETLNQLAIAGDTDMIKVSFFTYLLLQHDFILLDSGSALGFGNGPITNNGIGQIGNCLIYDLNYKIRFFIFIL